MPALSMTWSHPKEHQDLQRSSVSSLRENRSKFLLHQYPQITIKTFLSPTLSAGYIIVDDGGYPCFEHPVPIITPYKEPLQNKVQNHLNQHHVKACVTFVPLVTTCAVLHHICLIADYMFELVKFVRLIGVVPPCPVRGGGKVDMTESNWQGCSLLCVFTLWNYRNMIICRLLGHDDHHTLW